MKTAVAACALILGEEGPGGNKKILEDQTRSIQRARDKGTAHPDYD